MTDASTKVLHGLWFSPAGKLEKCWKEISARDSTKEGLGFLLDHSYSEETLKPEQLKGKDYQLYQLLHSLGLPWTLELNPVRVEIRGDLRDDMKCTETHGPDDDKSCMHDLNTSNALQVPMKFLKK